MLFNSMAYIAFLPIIFALYWIVPHKFRVCLLLVASYYFYMCWNIKYVMLLAFTTFVSYFTGILLEKIEDSRKKKVLIFSSVTLCVFILFVFKYFDFFFENVAKVLKLFSIKMHPITLNLLLPVGISFYIFQSISYIVDVYNERAKAEKNFFVYAVYISFFPKLVAGPIERTNNLIPQIKARHYFDEQKAIEGFKLILWGYYKKLVIADNLAIYVDRVYSNISGTNSFDKMVAILFFTIQIYCDFSGYSDIAIGTAKLLDIDLMPNFNAPYISTSIKEFWNRWHISLSSWLKDYVYIPLGGNRCSKMRNAINLMITFLVSGLWHGASWTFVVWGALHGFAQILENSCKNVLVNIKQKKIGRVLSGIIVFIFCNFAWIFFRAESFSDAIDVFSGAFKGIFNVNTYFHSQMLTVVQLAYLVFFCLILWTYDCVDAGVIIVKEKIRNSKVLGWIFYLFIGILILLYSRKEIAADFVYLQF